MHPADNESTPLRPPTPTSTLTTRWPDHPEIEPLETRNLLLLALHQVVLRVGWIFKTESVIMPAFMDWLVGGSGGGFFRGCMPVLNRFGQSVPPVFFATALKNMRRKKYGLLTCVLLMCLPFAILSVVCLNVDAPHNGWMPGLFLTLYGIFFLFNGLYQMSFGTVQGKLIGPTRRGHLLLVSTFWGSIPAMLFAWWLLDDWLALPGVGFGYIFAFTAVCFFLSGVAVLALSEPVDEVRPRKSTPSLWGIGEIWKILQRDRNMRRLALVAMLFGSALIIFPHYQTLARRRLDLSLEQSASRLMLWVITQNAAVGVYGLLVGPLADGWGNRLTLRLLIFGSAIAPPLAILLSYCGGWGASLYWTIFIALGVTPLVLRIMSNYALEICPPADHPRYLSTLSLCLAIPFMLSPGVGWLVDKLDFDVVFLAATGLILLGGLMTFRLDEPRYRVKSPPLDEVTAAGQP